MGREGSTADLPAGSMAWWSFPWCSKKKSFFGSNVVSWAIFWGGPVLFDMFAYFFGGRTIFWGEGLWILVWFSEPVEPVWSGREPKIG